MMKTLAPALAVLLLYVSAPALAKCIVGGCSSHLCIDDSKESGVSTCEWNDTYACYGYFSTCEQRPDGTCAWKGTPELKACLADPSIAIRETDKRTAPPDPAYLPPDRSGEEGDMVQESEGEGR